MTVSLQKMLLYAFLRIFVAMFQRSKCRIFIKLEFLSNCLKTAEFVRCVLSVSLSVSCVFPPVQVVALQSKLQALSEQNQQQSEELTVWRLASQPAPAFNKHHSTDGECGTSAAPDDLNQDQVQILGPEESPGNVTVIREDELFLSCSSNNLKGHMLFSR